MSRPPELERATRVIYRHNARFDEQAHTVLDTENPEWFIGLSKLEPMGIIRYTGPNSYGTYGAQLYATIEDDEDGYHGNMLYVVGTRDTDKKWVYGVLSANRSSGATETNRHGVATYFIDSPRTFGEMFEGKPEQFLKRSRTKHEPNATIELASRFPILGITRTEDDGKDVRITTSKGFHGHQDTLRRELIASCRGSRNSSGAKKAVALAVGLGLLASTKGSLFDKMRDRDISDRTDQITAIADERIEELHIDVISSISETAAISFTSPKIETSRTPTAGLFGAEIVDQEVQIVEFIDHEIDSAVTYANSGAVEQTTGMSVEELHREITEYNQQHMSNYTEASRAIDELLDMVDEGDYSGIHEKALEYQTRYEGQLKSISEIAEMRENINAATTQEELQDLIDEYFDAHNVHIHFPEDQETEVVYEDTRQRQHLDNSPFPISITALEDHDLKPVKAQLDQLVEFVSLFPADEFIKLLPGGEMNVAFVDSISSDEVPAGLEIAGVATDYDFYLTRSGGTFIGRLLSSGNVPVHEAAHVLDTPHEPRNEKNIINTILHAGGVMVNYPLHPSTYAFVGGSDEHHAELVTSLVQDGVPNPNNGWSFTSPVAENKLSVAMDFEAEMPGFTAHLVRHGYLESSRLFRENSIAEWPRESHLLSIKYVLGIYLFYMVAMNGGYTNTKRRDV